jgi:hypothetical protein
MAQRTTAVKTPEAEKVDEQVEADAIADESVDTCCHHWVIQPADGPSSNGSCQVCGEIREFKNYVESATWGDSRTTGKGSTATATAESTSDDSDSSSAGADGPDTADDDAEPDASDLEADD